MPEVTVISHDASLIAASRQVPPDTSCGYPLYHAVWVWAPIGVFIHLVPLPGRDTGRPVAEGLQRGGDRANVRILTTVAIAHGAYRRRSLTNAATLCTRPCVTLSPWFSRVSCACVLAPGIPTSAFAADSGSCMRTTGLPVGACTTTCDLCPTDSHA